MQSMRSQRASSVPFDTLIVQKLLQEVKRVMFGGGCTEFRQLQRTTKIIIISSSQQSSQQEGKEENNKQNESPYRTVYQLYLFIFNILIYYASSSYSLFVLGVNRTEPRLHYLLIAS
jgi:hypothetical protein